MLVVGLTGGIGAGKSTFAALLVERGAQVVDADLLARDAVRPGEPAWHSIVDQFGDEILAPGSMEIDRQALGRIVFADPKKRAALNAIVHPVVFAGIADALERLRATEEIVVVDAPLLVETGLDEGLDVVVVVTAPEERRIERLRRSRGMTPQEARARIAAQAPEAVLVAKADLVVDNGATPEALAGEADRVWTELERRRAAKS